MARRSKRTVAKKATVESSKREVLRDSFEPSMRDPLLDRSRLSPRRLTADRLAIEDLRREHDFLTDSFPEQPYRKTDGSLATAVSVEVPVRQITGKKKAAITGNFSSRLRRKFADPEHVMVCVRRKERREVLFAMKRTGRGGRKNRRAVWTQKSEISCK